MQLTDSIYSANSNSKSQSGVHIVLFKKITLSPSLKSLSLLEDDVSDRLQKLFQSLEATKSPSNEF
jgi:hypothetical protein